MEEEIGEEELIVGGELLLYGDVGETWWGDGFTPRQVAEALAIAGPGPLTVRINSGGGIAFDGVAIYSLLKSHDGEVTIIVDGIAASAASLIAMAGKLKMREGSMLMIHDASSIAWGNATEMERTAAVLNKLSDQYARLYAQKSGGSDDEMREIMKAETWLTAEEAVALKLCDEIIKETETEPKPVAQFDYRLYAKTPASIMARRRAPPEQKQPAATSSQPLAKTEPKMTTKPKETNVDDPEKGTKTDGNTPTAKVWAYDFMQLAATKGLTLAETNTIIAAVPSMDQAKDHLIDTLHAKQSGQTVDPNGNHPAIITADAKDKWSEGVTQAFLANAGIGKHDSKSEFIGYRPMDLVRDCLAHANIKLNTRDPRKMVAAVMTNGNSDFSNITYNIAFKAMLTGYEETEETFEKWTTSGSLPDFKTARRVDLNLLPALPQVAELGEYNYLYTGDRGEAYSIATSGGLFTISRQAVINDDLDLFGKIPRRLGRAAKRTIGNDVYGVLTNNPAMGDGNTLFHATHVNSFTGAGSALQTTSMQTAWQAMALQKDRTQTAVVLGITPKYLITPVALKLTALQLLKSTAAIGQSNPGVVNTVQNLVEEQIAEARLDAASSTAWYLAADGRITDTVEVLYLNGVKEPMIEEFTVPDIDGIGYKIRMDYGVKAFGWEGLSKSAGV